MQETIEDSTHAHIELEQETDGRWIAELPAIPGMNAYGRTPSEAVHNLRWLAETTTDWVVQKMDSAPKAKPK